MKKLIIGIANEDDYMVKEWRKNGIDFCNILYNVPKIKKYIRRYMLINNIGNPYIWYRNLEKEICSHDLAIIQDSPLLMQAPKYIKKLNPNIKIILWYWNPVTKNTDPRLISDEICEKWSFDIENCKKYNMKFNEQYYFKTIKLPKNKIEKDIFFVGLNKGRLDIIDELYNKCISIKLKLDFNVVFKRMDIKKYYKRYRKYKSNYMSYEEVLEHISKSRAILDITQLNQAGISLRPLEALFFSKKLITNNKMIKKYDFYNPNNIFILGDDNIDDLPKFLYSPYNSIDEAIIDRYDFNSWLERFQSH